MGDELRLEVPAVDVEIEPAFGHRQRQRRSPVQRRGECGDEGAIELDDRDVSGAVDAATVSAFRQALEDLAPAEPAESPTPTPSTSTAP